MIADGWHHRSDAISSVVILVGIFLGQRFWWIDGVLGILVSLLLFYATFSILKENISVLLGERIEDSLKKEVILIATLVSEDDLRPHHFLIHQYGYHTEMTFHIRLPAHFNLHEAHEIGTAYEQLINKKTKIWATVHIDSMEEEMGDLS